MSFEKRLQQVMTVQKKTQTDITNDTSINRSTVSQWVNGKVVPGVKNTHLLAEYFDCRFDWLKNGEGNMFEKSFPASTTAREIDAYLIQQSDKLNTTQDSDINPTVRKYRELAEMDEDTLGEIQTWLNDMDRYRPGFTGWFRLEFQNRFPEFDDWKKKVTKQTKKTGTDY